MAIETKLITAEELFQMPDSSGLELVDGELRRMSPSGREHGWIAGKIHIRLGVFVEERGLGETMIAECGFVIRRNPDTVRVPDVAFVCKERWTAGTTYFEGPPDLAVEVISPTDSYKAVDEKVREWLQAGTRIVIVINPRNQTAAIHRSLTESTQIDIDGSLDAGDVVPGWTLPLRDLFVS